MKTFIGDANIFLRFLTKDVLEQAIKIKKIFEEAEKGKLKILILNITLVEIVFQLEHWYHLSRNEIAEKLTVLFLPSWIEIENKEIIFYILEIYKHTRVDFVDLIIFGFANKRNLRILSFDKDYDKLSPHLRQES